MKTVKGGLLAVLFVLFALGSSYGFEGEGTESAPYKVQSAKDLFALAERVNGGEQYEGAYFFQTVDIDLEGEPWSPIGTEAKPFLGSYDGAGHTISNLVISGNRSSRLGLFGLVGKGGASGKPYISGVRLEKVVINAGRKVEDLAIGALAGEVRSGYTVRACAAVVSAMAFESADGGSVSMGGLVGIADGCELWDCWVDRTKDGKGMVAKSNDACILGGLVGRFDGFAMEKTKAQVQRAFADVDVTAQIDGSTLGGFIGSAKDVWVADCFSLGDVSGSKGDVALFIGKMDGSGNCCYTTGKLQVNGTTKNPLMMAAGGSECDNYYYKRYFGLFLSGPEEKYGRKFSEDAIKGVSLPAGFSQRSWEVRSGQPPILKMKTGGMAVR